MKDMTSKKEQRKKAKEQRDSYPKEKRDEAARQMEEALFSLNEWKETKRVFAYASFGSEVSTKGILAGCYREGKEVYLPKMEGKHISFYPVDAEDVLHIHPYGIEEPIPKGKPVLAKAGDVILVPGLLFTKEGYRLGYGGGFYDRFLKACPDAFTVGLAFSCQMTEKLEVESWDLPVKLVLTEETDGKADSL